MNTRTNLHAGAECSALATFWKKQALAAQDVAQKCHVQLPPINVGPYYPYYPYYPQYDYPPVVGSTGTYHGQDYSGFCG